ncbi:MAG: hypothetical protein K2Q97_00330 [Burkholderiaceae bacterium]|nr:hypothetical protein [Burkholderiaceae bacterium]
MSRAAFVYKSKEELLQLSLQDINAYIRVLRLRASFLGNVPRKSTEKQVQIAERIRDAIVSPDNV